MSIKKMIVSGLVFGTIMTAATGAFAKGPATRCETTVTKKVTDVRGPKDRVTTTTTKTCTTPRKKVTPRPVRRVVRTRPAVVIKAGVPTLFPSRSVAASAERRRVSSPARTTTTRTTVTKTKGKKAPKKVVRREVTKNKKGKVVSRTTTTRRDGKVVSRTTTERTRR